MNVEAVYREIDTRGRQVLFARLSNGLSDVIRYVDDIRYVSSYIIADDDISEAYEKYDLHK